MKTTISNIGQMRAANKGKNGIYAPFYREVLYAEQLHKIISGENCNAVDVCKDRYDEDDVIAYKEYVKTCLTGGR